MTQRLNYSIENHLRQNLTNIKKLISYLKTPAEIIDSFKNRLAFLSTGFSRIIKNNFQIAVKDLYLLSNNLKISNDLLKFNKSNLKNRSQNLESLVKREFKISIEKYQNFLRLLETNSIHSNLNKGYSILSKNKKIINDSKLIKDNDTLSAILKDRTIKIKIKKIN